MDSKWHGDYRPGGEFGQLRTVCHGCRHLSQVHVDTEDEVAKLRPMVIPGDGSVTVELAPGYMASMPCPVCGESEDPGWIPGFQPPV